MGSFSDRIIRAAKLDRTLYEEVKTDQGSFVQAMGVVAFSSVAAGIATIGKGGLGGIVIGTLLALITWYIWVFVTYIIGTKFFPEPNTHADFRELFRTIGFASSPGIIQMIGIIPGLTSAVFIVASLWMMAAMVVAVQQILDYSNILRAIGVCGIGWIIYTIVFKIFFSMIR